MKKAARQRGFFVRLKNPKRCPWSPSRHNALVPAPSGPGTLWPKAWHLPRRPSDVLRLRRAHAGLPVRAACVPAAARRLWALKDGPSSLDIQARSRSRHSGLRPKDDTATVKLVGRFLYLAYSHAKVVFL